MSVYPLDFWQNRIRVVTPPAVEWPQEDPTLPLKIAQQMWQVGLERQRMEAAERLQRDQMRQDKVALLVNVMQLLPVEYRTRLYSSSVAPALKELGLPVTGDLQADEHILNRERLNSVMDVWRNVPDDAKATLWPAVRESVKKVLGVDLPEELPKGTLTIGDLYQKYGRQLPEGWEKFKDYPVSALPDVVQRSVDTESRVRGAREKELQDLTNVVKSNPALLMDPQVRERYVSLYREVHGVEPTYLQVPTAGQVVQEVTPGTPAHRVYREYGVPTSREQTTTERVPVGLAAAAAPVRVTYGDYLKQVNPQLYRELEESGGSHILATPVDPRDARQLQQMSTQARTWVQSRQGRTQRSTITFDQYTKMLTGALRRGDPNVLRAVLQRGVELGFFSTPEEAEALITKIATDERNKYEVRIGDQVFVLPESEAARIALRMATEEARARSAARTPEGLQTLRNRLTEARADLAQVEAAYSAALSGLPQQARNEIAKVEGNIGEVEKVLARYQVPQEVRNAIVNYSVSKARILAGIRTYEDAIQEISQQGRPGRAVPDVTVRRVGQAPQGQRTPAQDRNGRVAEAVRIVMDKVRRLREDLVRQMRERGVPANQVQGRVRSAIVQQLRGLEAGLVEVGATPEEARAVRREVLRRLGIREEELR